MIARQEQDQVKSQQLGRPAWGDKRRSGSSRHDFLMWAGLSNGEEADAAGLGRGKRDGAAAWPARTAAHLLLPRGPGPAARCAGEQGEVPGGVAPPPRCAGPGTQGHLLQGLAWVVASGGTALPFPPPS